MLTFQFEVEVMGFNLTIVAHGEVITDALTFAQELKKNGEFMPRKRWERKEDTPFEPFIGTVESIEKTQTKAGKDMWVAHVRPDKSTEQEPQKELVSFKFMNVREWRVGDRVKVTKNDKGWLEGHEPEGDTPPPF